MAIVLYRIDERLIHGQVVVGWGSKLRPNRYVVVDETLAESRWEQELYGLGVPPDSEALFLSPDRAREEHAAWRVSPSRTVLLTRDIGAMLTLAQGGLLRDEEVNLGGVHHRPGREEVLPYLYMDDDDRELLKALEREGARVSAQDLPGSPKVPLTSLLALSQDRD
jgi:PTS system mannose-specific IIB component/fructoselysine and glucoselysine-specific PTS system IIB component